MEGKVCILGFKGGQNAEFGATDPHEDPYVALRLTRVQSLSNPVDNLACFARALDSDPRSDPFD